MDVQTLRPLVTEITGGTHDLGCVQSTRFDIALDASFV